MKKYTSDTFGDYLKYKVLIFITNKLNENTLNKNKIVKILVDINYFSAQLLKHNDNIFKSVTADLYIQKYKLIIEKLIIEPEIKSRLLNYLNAKFKVILLTAQKDNYTEKQEIKNKQRNANK